MRRNAHYISSDCIYFTLQGVTEADIRKPWFMIHGTRARAKDAYAMLLAAKLSGALVTVKTNDASICGYAIASELRMD